MTSPPNNNPPNDQPPFNPDDLDPEQLRSIADNVSPIRGDIDISDGGEGGSELPETAPAHFQCLGHNQGSFFFLPSRGKQVVRMRAADLGRVPCLLQLAPLHWWEAEFVLGSESSGFKGAALNAATNRLIQVSYQKGVFSFDSIRGRGVWHDAGRTVVHFGDCLTVDGNRMEIGAFTDTRYVYEAKQALPSYVSDPLPDPESIKLLQLCKLLSWEHPLHATLAAGWMTSSIACGCLRWRPHLLITGPSGCGKSWTVETFQQILGPWVFAAKGESTEAGLRQAIQHDALPVTWDEAEGEDHRTAANLDRVLGLMRQASADIGGKIFKGGEGGQASTFTVQTSFLLSAIRVPMKQLADQSRITVLSLRRNTEADRQRFVEQIIPLSDSFRENKWAERFRARVLRHADVLRRNALTFAEAAGDAIGNARVGDQLGAMLGGAALLQSTNPVTPEKARAWVGEIDLSDHLSLTEIRDEDQLLAALLEAHIQVPRDRSTTTASIGELVELCHGLGDLEGIDIETARSALARHGVKYLDDKVAVSNTHRMIARLLRDTAWGVGWQQIFTRLEGAEQAPGAIRFSGSVSRAVFIPISYFVGG